MSCDYGQECEEERIEGSANELQIQRKAAERIGSIGRARESKFSEYLGSGGASLRQGNGARCACAGGQRKACKEEAHQEGIEVARVPQYGVVLVVQFLTVSHES
jgi:hypothetical protein